MKKTNILLFVMLLFSIIVEAGLSIIPVHAETKEIQLVNEEFLELSYTYEQKEDANRWILNFKHKSANDTHEQRLKFKIMDEKNQVIDYPTDSDMIKQDDWLIEKDFSEEKSEQVSFTLSQSVKTLKLYVQMDQREKNTEDESKATEIQEDILERKKPFILKAEQKSTEKTKEGSSEKVEIKKEEQVTTVSSENFVGPKKESQKNSASKVATAANGTGRMYSPLYENKVTKYKHDAGTYPEFSWKPTGQTNVINHQGGLSSQPGWDGVESWNVASDDFSKSYIKYGDEDNANIQLRKYAQETNNPEEFKVKLNVRGNTTYKPGVDIVFLIDNSDSMSNASPGSTQSRKKNAQKALKDIVNKLKDVNVPAAENIRIGGHIFSDYDRNAWGYKPSGGSSEKSTFSMSKNPADWDKLVDEYTRADPMGATFTQRGLAEAGDIFTDATDSEERHKLLFVLTDGAPNVSWTTADRGTADPEMFYDQLHFKDFNKGTKGNYNKGSYLGAQSFRTMISPAYNGVINSHITTTNSTAMDLKNAGIEIHTIALAITVNTNELGIKPTLMRGLYKMSTKKANATNGPNNDVASDFHFYDVENGDNLTSYFDSWYETIVRTVDKGTITDPLGEMVELVGTPTWRQVDNSGKQIETGNRPVITLSNNNRQIDVSNINLAWEQEIEIEYKVRLKINDDSFVSNRWYPANGETILRPTPERTNDELEFGRPSVKYLKEDFVIPVEKVWSDTYKGESNYWNLRPDKVSATLQKLNGSTWQDVETIELKRTSQWKASFSPVEGGSDNKYRVVETARTNGYKQPTVNKGEFTSDNLGEAGVKITNELLQGDYQFWKFMGDGQGKFGSDLPKFKVTRSNGKVLAENLEPDSSGKVSLTQLPIGDYTVEETYVPKGFKKMANFTINVTESSSNPPTSLVFTVGGSTEDYAVRNELKDFSLIVEKVNENDTRLAGATFRLTGPNYNEIKSNGPTFDFPNLRPGIYTLTETDNPDGYERIIDPITFVISQDGKVTVNGHPNVSGSGGIGDTGNVIQLKVTNKRVREGALPRTGSIGIQGMFLTAGLLVIGGILLSIVTLYLNRSKK